MRNRELIPCILTAAAVLVLWGGRTLAQTTQPASEELSELKQTPAETDRPGGEGEQTDPDKKLPPADQKGRGLLDSPLIFVLLGGFVLLYVFMGRGRRKQEAKRKAMLANLKKGDKVTTIGGIVGTVIEVREDDVTVKVDETNNVRMKFLRRAVQGIGDEAKAERK